MPARLLKYAAISILAGVLLSSCIVIDIHNDTKKGRKHEY
jgi:hypothetical protein